MSRSNRESSETSSKISDTKPQKGFSRNQSVIRGTGPGNGTLAQEITSAVGVVTTYLMKTLFPARSTLSTGSFSISDEFFGVRFDLVRFSSEGLEVGIIFGAFSFAKFLLGELKCKTLLSQLGTHRYY